MNAEQLLAHYEEVADAPEAIVRLRRFILDLAVRGKLVDQDSNDEPASELMKRIAVEKARLVKAGQIRKEKPLRPVQPFEIPYAVPLVWEWVRLAAGSIIVQGFAFSSEISQATPSLALHLSRLVILGRMHQRYT